jgi:aspartate aminotransferase-like enzyme
MSLPWNPLLDAPAYPADGYARLADRIGALLRTRNDTLLVQGEAIVALEAVATSLARPGVAALNVVTSPYGRWFGEWLRRGGAETADVVAQPGLPITVDAFSAALDAQPRTNAVVLVHAESASGILNPLPEIARLAHARGAIVIVDAVASVGGHAFDVDALGVDIAVIGAQKALGGSPGVSALSISKEAWALLDVPRAPSHSMLSLLDLKQHWLDRGRGALPGMPSALEFHALEAALDRVEAEGIDAIIGRHRRAGAASRDGLRALGVPRWVEDRSASNLVTAALMPDGIAVADVMKLAARFYSGIDAGIGEIADRLVRLNHTGARARFDVVLANVLAYGHALRGCGHRVDIGAAAEAVTARYGSPD